MGRIPSHCTLHGPSLHGPDMAKWGTVFIPTSVTQWLHVAQIAIKDSTLSTSRLRYLHLHCPPTLHTTYHCTGSGSTCRVRELAERGHKAAIYRFLL